MDCPTVSTVITILLIGFGLAMAIMVVGEIALMLLPFVLGVWLITKIFSGTTAIVIGVIFVLFMVFRSKK